jgi:hypothetical protein
MRTKMVFKMLVFFTVQPLNLADSLRELHYTQSLGKQQILQSVLMFGLDLHSQTDDLFCLHPH